LLRWFTALTAASTFVLVCMGGLVTSHGAGLAVPDWPNSYGYNMFFFPISKWIGGIFYEHTHRLAASCVGLLTTILALWLFGYKSRPLLRWSGGTLLLAGLACCWAFPARIGEDIFLSAIGLTALIASFFWPKCEPSPRWLRVLGVVAFVAVVTQGVLGGLRVTELKDQLGIFHATLAQLFFVLVCAIALFHTAFWQKLPVDTEADRSGFRFLIVAAAALILCQLVLGATMRHQHAGLSIPDFPGAYGKLWPKTDAASITQYNQMRADSDSYKPITAFQVVLQMAHRIVALMIFAAVSFCAWRSFRKWGPRHVLTRAAFIWLGLIVCQITLGAATIWTGKSADVATAHVACGALSLLTGGLTALISFRLLAAPVSELSPAKKSEMTSLIASSSISR
jgi:heme a synthase